MGRVRELPKLSAGLVTTIAAFTAAAYVAAALGGPPRQVFRTVDSRLCGFRLSVTVTGRLAGGSAGTPLDIAGPGTILLRNGTTRRVVRLHASDRLWLGSESRVPFLMTDAGGSHPRVVDPCALLAPSPTSTGPATTFAPWGLPAFALSQIAYAGLTPVTRPLIRHDHVHLDIVVDGKKIPIPAGVGQAEPTDDGPGRCPPPPSPPPDGDCAAGHFTTPKVAISPLHPHTTSGIVHIESDRPARFTLGSFFDEWGVRFTASCLGGYCTRGAEELRIYVDGRRVRGDPRDVVLADGQEIAVVFGGAGAFAHIPSRFPGRRPNGCGGPGEHSCFS